MSQNIKNKLLSKIDFSEYAKYPPECRGIIYLGIQSSDIAEVFGKNRTSIASEMTGWRDIPLYKRLVYCWALRNLVRELINSRVDRNLSSTDGLHIQHRIFDAHNSFCDAISEIHEKHSMDDIYKAVDKGNSLLLEMGEDGPLSRYMAEGNYIPIRVNEHGLINFDQDNGEYWRIVYPPNKSPIAVTILPVGEAGPGELTEEEMKLETSTDLQLHRMGRKPLDVEGIYEKCNEPYNQRFKKSKSQKEE